MRELVSMVEAVTGTFTRSLWLLVVGALGLMAIFALMIGFTAPKVVDQVGERAERIGEKAIAAAREEKRASELARDGWGNPAPVDSDGSDEAPDSDRAYPGDGWGVDTQ